MGNASVQDVTLRSLMAQHELELCFPPVFQARHCEGLIHQVGHLCVPTVCVVPIASGLHQQARLLAHQPMLQVVRCEAPAPHSQLLHQEFHERQDQQFRSLVVVGVVLVVAQLNVPLYQ